MRLSNFFFFSLLCISGCSAAQAGDDVSSSQDAISDAPVIEGSFKLYDAPNTKANPNCDVHTSLTLSEKGAELREVVDGVCEIHVAEDARAYALELDGTSCGSNVYLGRVRLGEETREIKITDHRTRICRDLVPAEIIVEETHAKAKYSADASAN